MTPSKTQPALLGGLTIGVLSALPVINLANCCCAWILFGGALAAYLMQQNHAEPIMIGDGAIVGLLAGVIGALVWVIVSVPITLAMAPFQAAMTQDFLSNARDLRRRCARSSSDSRGRRRLVSASCLASS